MHERKTLTVRNPLKPVPERLPCKLTREEKYQRVERRFALERTVDDLDAKIAEVKAQAKVDASKLLDARAELATEMRMIREQVLQGEEQRLVDCLLLEDLAEGAIYVFRLDTGEVVQRKDMRPEELEELRQRKLPLEAPVTRTVDIPDGVANVKRFDSDPPGVDDDDREPPADDTGNGHEHSYNEGVCVTCGEYECCAEYATGSGEHSDECDRKGEPEVKPTRRKKGDGKRKGRGYDDRGAPVEAH